jgi:hypothetical protein
MKKQPCKSVCCTAVQPSNFGPGEAAAMGAEMAVLLVLLHR